MKNYFRLVIAILFSSVISTGTFAQKKKTGTKRVSAKTVTVKYTERNLGSPSSISEIIDLPVTDPAYESLKNLIENNGVILTYADNTFRGKDPLRRGDFIIAFNSALLGIRKAMENAGVLADTTLINTYDRNRGGAYLTSIDQVKDVSEKSIYYNAARSLIERWGIAAPFALNKTLSPNATISEKEVYDILRVTLGYNSVGGNPYSNAMSRSKFAIVLNNAVAQKMTEIYSIQSVMMEKKAAERKRQMDSLQIIEMARKDSISKEIELRKLEAAKKEEEARKKLLDKKK